MSTRSSQISFASGVNAILGIWLVVAAFTLSATSQAVWNGVIVGGLVIIFAAWRLSQSAGSRVGSWLNFILGIWLLFAPWALNYTSSAARWNDFVVGWVVLVLAAWSGSVRGKPQRVMEPGERRAA